MRILLLADPHGPGDEGARNVSKHIYRLLSINHDVLCIPASRVYLYARRIISFRPQVIHALHGPSAKTLHLLAFLHLVCPGASIFASLGQPDMTLFQAKRSIWHYYRFIKLLSQDLEREEFFSSLGFRVYALPNGVDTDQFVPVTPSLPDELAAQLLPGKKLVLHVGHIKKSRGLELLATFSQLPNWQAIVVGSTRFPAEPDVAESLRRTGCVLHQGFVDDLSALYSAVDAYVFPVTALDGSIDMPLTVLEALACGCPVISRPYKALPRFIPNGEGICYFQNEAEAVSCLENVNFVNKEVIRSKVTDLSWKKVVNHLVELYGM